MDNENQNQFEKEIQLLRSQLNALSMRLDGLEKRARAEEAAPERAPAQQPPQAPEPVAPATRPVDKTPPYTPPPFLQQPKTKIMGAASEASQKTVSAEKPPATPLAAKFASGGEAQIGKTGFALAGIVLLVASFVFFVKYAIDNNLIGPPMRIALGVAGGMILVALGARFNAQKRLKGYDQTLIGGGFALLYFTFYASHYFYGDILGIGRGFALAMLSAVVFFAVVFSVRMNAVAIAALAFLLGYFTSWLCGAVTTFTLFYDVVLAVGLVYLARRQGWIHLGVCGLAATYALHFIWLNANPDRDLANAGFLALYLIVFIDLGLSTISREEISSLRDFWTGGRLSANGQIVFYLAAAASLMGPLCFPPVDKIYMVYFLFVAAVVAAVTARFSLPALGPGAVVLSYLAFFFWNDQNEGLGYLPVLYLALLLAIFAAHAFAAATWSKKGGVAAAVAAVLNSLLFFLMLFEKVYEDFRPWAGLYVLSLAGLNLGLSALAKQKKLGALFHSYMAVAVAFGTLAVAVQLDRQYWHLLWSFECVAIMYLAMKFQNRVLLRIGQTVALVALTGALDRIGHQPLAKAVPLAVTSMCFFAGAHLLFEYEKKGPASLIPIRLSHVFGVAGAGVLMGFFYSILKAEEAYLLAWFVCGLGLAAFAFLFDAAWLRTASWFAYILAGAHMAELAESGPAHPVPLMLPCVLSGFGAAAIHFLGDRKQKDALNPPAAAAFAAGASVALAWLLALALTGAWITVAWAAQAIATILVGFGLRSQYVRYGGIALFAAALGKALLVDMASLDMAYRVVSLFGLAAFLLLASYMYYRNQERADDAQSEPEP